MLKPFTNKDLYPIAEAYGLMCENLTIPPNDDPLENELRKRLDRNYDHSDRIIRWFRNDRKSGMADHRLRSEYIENLKNIIDLLGTYDTFVKSMRANRMEKTKVRLDTPKGPMEFDLLNGLDRIRSLDGARRFIKSVGDILHSSTTISTDARKYAVTDADRRNIGIRDFTDNVVIWVTRTYESTNKFIYQLWQNPKTLGRGDVYGNPDEQTPYCTHSKEHWDSYSYGKADYEQYWILERNGVECKVGDLTDPVVVTAFNSLKGMGPKLLIAMDDSNEDLLDRNDRSVSDMGELKYGNEIRSVLLKEYIKRFDEWMLRVGRKDSGNYEIKDFPLLMDNLESYTIPEGVVNVPSHAFMNFTKLKHIHIPEGVETICVDAFKNCTELEMISLPDSLEQIGFDAFNGCRKLSDIRFGPKLWHIGGSAFRGCQRLKSVELPYDMLHISERAFSFSGLERIRVPGFISSISKYTFDVCDGLEYVEIGEGIEEICEGAFDCCTRLKTVVFPQSLEKIERATFYHCTSLEVVDLQDGIKEIDNYAFAFCSALKKVTIPNSIEKIGKNVFHQCTGITDLTIPERFVEQLDDLGIVMRPGSKIHTS